MSVSYAQFWIDTFGHVDRVSFPNAVNTFVLIGKISHQEHEKVLRGLSWLNNNDYIYKEDFINLFKQIIDSQCYNFQDSLLQVTHILADIIVNAPYVENNAPIPYIRLHNYYIRSAIDKTSYLFDIIYTSNYGYELMNISFDNKLHTYTLIIHNQVKRMKREAWSLISVLEGAAYGIYHINSYKNNMYQKIWSEAMGDEIKVCVDHAIEGFTHIIVNHKHYRRGDETSVEYLVAWLQSNHKEEFFITIQDFCSLISHFKTCILNNDDLEVPYLGHLSNLIKDIFQCDGFVNAIYCKNLPRSYYCLIKGMFLPMPLFFCYMGDELEEHNIQISFHNGLFTAVFVFSFELHDISLLIEIIKLAIQIPKKYDSQIQIPEHSIITYENGKFYFYLHTEDHDNRKELGNIHAVVKLFEPMTHISTCNKLKSISSQYGTIMYAPWNELHTRTPSWFNTFNVNTEYAESYKNGKSSTINEMSIIKKELSKHIKNIFGDKMCKFIHKLGDPLVTSVYDSFLPYFIYLTCRTITAVVEIHNENTITVSCSVVRKTYNIDECNFEEVLNLLNTFKTPILGDKLLELLLSFYEIEGNNYYLQLGEDHRICRIKEIVARYL